MIASAQSAILGVLTRTLEILVEYCDSVIQAGATNAQKLGSARLDPDDLPLTSQIEQLIALIADTTAGFAGNSPPVMLRPDHSFQSLKQRALLASLFVKSVRERSGQGVSSHTMGAMDQHGAEPNTAVIPRVITALAGIYHTLCANDVSLDSPEFLFLPEEHRLTAAKHQLAGTAGPSSD